jgi:hypothetical protein
MDSLPIIIKTYEIYKAVFDINNHLEKRQRYSLGQSLENTVLIMLENFIMAKNAPKPLKAAYLIKAGAQQETTVLKLRLLMELKLANQTKIFQTQAKLAEVGRMLGGWLKSLNS